MAGRLLSKYASLSQWGACQDGERSFALDEHVKVCLEKIVLDAIFMEGGCQIEDETLNTTAPRIGYDGNLLCCPIGKAHC